MDQESAGVSGVSAITVDAASGITTGISAADRARTIWTLAHPSAKPSDLCRPGHVIPSRVKVGGVLENAGKPEAAVDLCRLAGLVPAAARAEILASDGDIARGDELRAFAEQHDLPVVEIPELVAHRQRFDRLVERITDCRLPTAAGAFRAVGYRVSANGSEHVALVAGDPANSDPPLVRVHRECVIGDVFRGRMCACRVRLEQSLVEVADCGCGVIVYLRGALGWGVGLAYRDADDVSDVDDVSEPEHDYSTAAAILRDLGVRRFRALIGDREVATDVVAALGLEVVECVSLIRKSSSGRGTG
jgi:3,4-dihydroxy 2-butanone 4-phosphate synthase/GTP cyclohydrolase II